MPELAFLLACAGLAPPTCEPADVPLPDVVTTLSRTLVADPSLPETSESNPGFPEGLAVAEAAGLGGHAEGPGEAWTVREELAASVAHGERRSLALFLHESDAQIADAESPIRLAAADGANEFQSAVRPQELYAVHALDGLARAANGIHARVGIDFLLATGDDGDNVQANELAWFRDVLDGSELTPDAGDHDSQPDEDCRDPIATFTPVGLEFPWYAVAGNHDVLVQGNLAPEPWRDDAVGSDAPYGTRDLSEPGGPLAWSTVPDPARELLDRGDLAALMLESPATPGPSGHGFTAENVGAGTVSWTADPAPGLRLIAIDANADGPQDAELSASERDEFLLPALAQAERDGRLVIVASHYAAGELDVEGGGTLADLLVQWPGVVLMVAGHYHQNRIRAYGTAEDPRAFWEILTSSTVDWPQQGRLVELVDNGDGTLSTFTTMLDFLGPEGTLAARARKLALIDLQTGWRLGEGTGEPSDRNTELIQRLPDGWSAPAELGAVRSTVLP